MLEGVYMKKLFKRFFASLMVAVMILSAAPLSGVAGFDWSCFWTVKVNALSSNGSCGNNVKYTFNSSTGLLTISGNGKMSDYSFSGSPFYENSSIKHVVVTDGVTSIGDYTFEKCKLESIEITTSVISIGSGAFERSSLKTIKIPDSVVSIGDNAFTACSFLTEVNIPDGVEVLSGVIFQSCENLKKIKIGRGLNNFCNNNYQAIGGCDSLESFEVDSNNNNYYSEGGVLFNKDGTELFFYPSGKKDTNYLVPLSVEKINKSAFAYNIYLTNVIIPNSVDFIGACAFMGCEKLKTAKIYNPKCDFNYQINDLSIARDTFSNTVVLYGCKNSTTEEYAKKYNRIFVEISLFDEGLEYYVDYWDSFEYNARLANMMCTLSEAVYNKSDIEKAYISLGFKEGNFAPYDYDGGFNPYKCGYYLGFKDSETSSETICLVTVRGSSNISDWAGNLSIQTLENEKHTGFSLPADNIFLSIIEQIKDKKISTGNIKFFITGHSRGAAVANLLSVKLMENGVSESNIYNYNIACPDVACKHSFENYNNIFNICNRSDVVPFVPGVLASAFTSPGTCWGKFGQTYYFTNFISTNPLDNHSCKKAYLPFLNNQLNLEDWPESSVDKMADASFWAAGLVTKVFCPVNVKITDRGGKTIASVINGEVNYYNSNFGDVVILTDGDKKVIYVNGEKDFNVSLIGTDKGKMKYSVEKYNLLSDVAEEIKTFENVSLYKGKKMWSPVSEAETTEDIELFVVEKEGDESTIISSIDALGTESEATNSKIKNIFLQIDEERILSVTKTDTDQNQDYIYEDINWSSSEENIASIDSCGKVTAHKPGTTKIIAKTTDGLVIDYRIVSVIGIAPKEDTNIIFNYPKRIVYGFDSDIDDYYSCISLLDKDCRLEIDKNSEFIGTGDEIKLIRDDEIIDRYATVLFGDVNGDGKSDGMDSIIIDCISKGMLSDEQISEATNMAADCNCDGIISSIDIYLTECSGLHFYTISQNGVPVTDINIPFSENTTYEEGTEFISDIYVYASSSSSIAKERLRSRGYTVIDYDLNKGARGDYVYLGYKTTTDYDNAIKDIRFYSDTNDLNLDTTDLHFVKTDCTYYLSNKVDLNSNAQGNYVYAFYSKSSAAGPAITSIEFGTPEEMAGKRTASLFNNSAVPADLNENTAVHDMAIFCGVTDVNK